jgi:hypothetical protein
MNFSQQKSVGWALPTFFFCAYTAKGIMRGKPGPHGEYGEEQCGQG